MNTTFDGLRGVSIAYNILNLPKLVSKGSDNIAYIYSAAGEKLAKKKKEGTYQYYAGNMVYNNDRLLDYLLFDEGLVTKTSSVYSYEYHLKDHLGNTRVSFQPNGSGGTNTTQVAEYYPFGSSYLPVYNAAGTNNKYLYNGKEKQDDFLSGTALDWYDYGARFYDPTIGRWMTVDPKAEKRYNTTTYAFCSDNPINRTDPDGMLDDKTIKKLKPKEDQLVASSDATATPKPILKPTITTKPINTQANSGTIRGLPDAYTSAWLQYTSPDMQPQIAFNPVFKGVASGALAGLVVVGTTEAAPVIAPTLARSALTLSNAAEVAAYTLQTNTLASGAAGVAVGFTGSVVKLPTTLPTDAVTLPGPTAELMQQMTTVMWSLFTNSPQQQSNAKNEKDKK